MKLSFKSIAPSMVMAAAFACAVATNANGQTVIGSDDFDGGGVFTSRTFSPDNSANGGRFAADGSFFDIFGIVRRDDDDVFDNGLTFDFQDDSVSIFVTDTQGFVSEDKFDQFLGFADIENGDNPNGTFATVTWTFDVTGDTDLGVSFQMAAMGTFESSDVFTVSVGFDGGTLTEIARAIGDDDNLTFEYTMDSGTIVPLESPMTFDDGTIVENDFDTFSFPIVGTGSTLTVEINLVQNAGSEPIGLDNLMITSGGVVASPTGDFDNDGDVDCDDIDLFAGNIGSSSATFDLNGDGTVDLLDVELHVETLVVTSNGVTGTFIGDVNCDGQVSVLGDAFALVASLGMSGTVYTQGDLNLSGNVDVLGDAFVLVANLGMSNN